MNDPHYLSVSYLYLPLIVIFLVSMEKTKHCATCNVAFPTKDSGNYQTKKFHKASAKSHVSKSRYLRHCLMNLKKANAPLDHFNMSFDPDVTLSTITLHSLTLILQTPHLIQTSHSVTPFLNGPYRHFCITYLIPQYVSIIMYQTLSNSCLWDINRHPYLDTIGCIINNLICALICELCKCILKLSQVQSHLDISHTEAHLRVDNDRMTQAVDALTSQKTFSTLQIKRYFQKS